jgi:hypothetical protein
MKQFFLHLLKVIGLTLVLAVIFNFIIGEWFYRIHSRSRLAIRDANYDILFLGSSRCIHNIDPAIIDSSLKVKSFNFAFDASGLPEMYASLKVYLQFNAKPKLVCCQVDFWHPHENADILARQSFIKYHNKGIIDDYFNSFPDEKYLNIPLYVYVIHRDLGWREWLKSCFRNKEALEEVKLKKGYEALYTTNFIQKPDKYNCDTLQFKKNPYLLKIIDLCNKNDIKLLLFTSPIYRNNCDKYFENFNSYELPYLNQADMFKDTSYFRDRDHVNSRGAIIQTVEMSEYLKARPDLYR